MIREFLELLCSSDITFLRYAMLAGLIGSIPLGITGTLVVCRNISSVAGALAHAVLGGVGFALYANRVWHIQWLTPVSGAMIGAVIAVILVYCASIYLHEKEDTVISMIWALGMSIGLLFIAATPGYVDLQGYLFGNILLVTSDELKLTIILSAATLILAIIFFRPLQSVLFDPEFAKLRKVNVNFLYFLLLILIAFTVVLMVNVAGIILLVALLSLPAATAKFFIRKLSMMMFLATIFAMLAIVSGLFAGYTQDLPTGPLSVIFAVLFYITGFVKSKIAKLKRIKND